jgi:hypothetical protein
MRYSPSIAPEANDGTYFVLNDFGDGLGRAWPEADEDRTDRETVVRDLLVGQHSNPVQVIAFNAVQGWSRDVSKEIASELADLIAVDGRDVPTWLEDFIEEYVGSRPIQLPLALRAGAV